MKTIAAALISMLILVVHSPAQTPPSCASSGLRYLEVQNGPTGATLLFAVSPPQPMVQSYFLRYTLNLDSGPAPGALPVPVPGAPQSFSNIPNNRLHSFTAYNVCTNGSAHTGATFLLDFRNASPDCPAIRDFQLLDLSPAFIAFAWGAAPGVDSFRVSYQADAFPPQTGFTPEPFWEQPLLPATVHTFRIAALCTVPGITEQAVVEGPEFVFSIIIVDDIKAIAVPLDTAGLRDALCKGYRIQCDHGDYGADKERFIADHSQLGIATPCPAVVATQEISHVMDNLHIAPNPGGEEARCTFTLRSAGVVQIDLLDYAGRLRQSRRVLLAEGMHSISLAAGDLPPGMYMVRLQSDGRIFSTKWAKH